MNTENQPIDLVSAALVECQGELKAAEFDATNPFFKSKYATLGSVIAASRQALSKAGLAILQIPTINEHLVSVHTKIVHKSGQILDCGAMTLSLGESDRNSDAQLAGSITTYLRRYAWSTVLGIYADSDTDGNDAPKGAVPRQASRPPQQPNQPTKTPTSGTTELVIGPKYRLQTLNKLQAAPGGPKRALVHEFLTVKKWIRPDQEPEEWDLNTLPKTGEEFVAIGEEIQRFERERRDGR